jgi:LysM repeat protein
VSIRRYLHIVLFVAALGCPGVLSGQVKTNAVYQQYIEIYKDLAIEQMRKYSIPASITLAQGLLESSAGRSSLATMGNNHFGIKCHDWTGPTMLRDDDAPNECFRVYSNPRASFEDHSKFLQRPRYQSLFRLKVTDYRGWANGLKACGYATSPTYAQKLINIIEAYQLYQYDTQRTVNTFVLKHSVTSPKVQLQGQQPHRLYSYNKNYYIIARHGDTFTSLSKELRISAIKLAKYNERDKVEMLADGDVVYLMKKQKHAVKEYRGRYHVVKNGESLYSIAQHYGVRLSRLYIWNRLPLDYSAKVGDRIYLY